MSSAATTVSNVISTTASMTSAAASCITATPDKFGHVPLNDCRAIWAYYPSFAAAIIFTVIFGMSTVIHIFQSFHYRMKFCWVIIMAGFWETAGFTLRILSTRHQLSFGFFIPEELLILLAPIWVNAFDYMLLGRMVYFFLPEQKVIGIQASKFAKYFVLMDIAAFIIQGTGGSIMSGGPDKPIKVINAGLYVYMAGIGLQEFFILFFVSTAVIFHRRMLVLEREGTLAYQGKPSWRPMLYTLYASLTLITIRIIFRLVQYSSGFLSAIPTHEGYFYGLEALPMALALFLMNITHPGRTLVGPEAEFPTKTRKERKEEKRIKKEAKNAEKEDRKIAKIAAKEAKKAGKADGGSEREQDELVEEGRMWRGQSTV